MLLARGVPPLSLWTLTENPKRSRHLRRSSGTSSRSHGRLCHSEAKPTNVALSPRNRELKTLLLGFFGGSTVDFKVGKRFNYDFCKLSGSGETRVGQVTMFGGKLIISVLLRWGKVNKQNTPGPPKECFLEVFCYIKPTKKHSFGGPGT